MVMIVGGGMVKESWAVVWLAVVERRCADVQQQTRKIPIRDTFFIFW
jgi:hypothetical protein